MVKLHPQARAHALLNSRTDWTEVRQRLRTQTSAGIKTALTTCAPDLDDKVADDVAAVVLNNLKTMVGMTMKDAPTTPGRARRRRHPETEVVGHRNENGQIGEAVAPHC
jgi:hypothetical protein